MIEVVSALIVEQGRVLLTQRRPDQDFAGCWETPGGKIEGNESWHEALRRELREEVGVELSGISEHPLWCGSIERPGKEEVFVLLLRADLTPNSVPRPLEGQGIGWFGLLSIPHLPLMPANKAAWPRTQEFLSRYCLDFSKNVGEQ